MEKLKMTKVKLNNTQAAQVEQLNPADGSEFAVVGQVFVGIDPRAGQLYCYQFNRKQYDLVAKAIRQALEIA